MVRRQRIAYFINIQIFFYFAFNTLFVFFFLCFFFLFLVCKLGQLFSIATRFSFGFIDGLLLVFRMSAHLSSNNITQMIDDSHISPARMDSDLLMYLLSSKQGTSSLLTCKKAPKKIKS